MKTIKIMTYNIMHGLDYNKLHYNKERVVDLKKIAFIVKKYDIDILNINEIYGSAINEGLEFFNQVESLKKLLNFPYSHFAKAIDTKNGEYGNAMLSKLPFDATDIPIPDPLIKDEDTWYESRVLTKYTFENINVYGTHFGLASSEALNAYKTFKENVCDGNVIFLGDFNITPDNNIIKSLMKDYNEATYYKNNKWINSHSTIDPKVRIDYIFLSKNIEVEEANVIDYVHSDHYPVYAKIKIGE